MSSQLRFGAFFDFRVFDSHGCVRDHQRAKNTMTINGLTLVAAGIAYSGVQDQAANLNASPLYIAPIYGAVGTGTAVPTSGDSQLQAEIARTTVVAFAGFNGEVVWDFFFSVGEATGQITEAGVFGQATSAQNDGTLINHVIFPQAIAVAASETCLLEVQFSLTQG